MKLKTFAQSGSFRCLVRQSETTENENKDQWLLPWKLSHRSCAFASHWHGSVEKGWISLIELKS